MFGSGKLKQELSAAQAARDELQAENQALRQELEEAHRERDQVQVRRDSDHERQQRRFRELWFTGSEAVFLVRESLAAAAGELEQERHQLRDAQGLFDHSSRILGTIKGALETIAADAGRNCEHVSELQETAQEITKFVGVISEISEQTNLLALNAAIEAARAGEQGRGFAVVADEVRALAQKANSASGEISRLVNSISQRTTVADSDIRGMAEQSTELVQSTQEVDETVHQVLDLSRRMHGIVGRSSASAFIETVRLDHVVWKTEVYKATLGLSEKTAGDFADHTQCRLGRWYFEGEGQRLYRDSRAFQALDAPHKRVHEQGLEALKKMAVDDCDGALEALAAMEEASRRVFDELGRLEEELSD